MKLIVLAAGRGSRFTKEGIYLPKPLVLFRKKPLFWWATESALSSNSFSSIHFAILRDHIESHSIDEEILALYPHSTLHIIERVTSGAAETAAIVAENLISTSPIAFIDCDLAFSFENRQPFAPLNGLVFNAALCIFRSNNPAFSYALFNNENKIVGTIEKEVKSDWAICGLYGFQSPQLYLEHYSEYQKNCPYNELFLSGIINTIAEKKGVILPVLLSEHLSLGTPDDIKTALNIPQDHLPLWYSDSL